MTPNVPAIPAPDLSSVNAPGEVLLIRKGNETLYGLLIGCPGCGGDVLLKVEPGDLTGDLEGGTLNLAPAFGHECGWRGHLRAGWFVQIGVPTPTAAPGRLGT